MKTGLSFITKAILIVLLTSSVSCDKRDERVGTPVIDGKTEDTGKTAEDTDELTPIFEDYIVLRDGAEVLSEPRAGSSILDTLNDGDHLTGFLGPGDTNREDWDNASLGFDSKYFAWYWRRVKSGNTEGWVDECDILPGRIFGYFAEADELGLSGNNEAMVSELERIRRMSFNQGEEGDFIDISPLRDAVLIEIGDYPEVGPSPSDCYEHSHVLFFKKGEGLAYGLVPGPDLWGDGVWSSDSRFFAFGVSMTNIINVYILDLYTGRYVDRSFRCTERDYEYVEGYFLCIDQDETRDYTPSLIAYNLEDGEEIRVLGSANETRRELNDFDGFEITLYPMGECPAGVEKTGIYAKYNGKPRKFYYPYM